MTGAFQAVMALGVTVTLLVVSVRILRKWRPMSGRRTGLDIEWLSRLPYGPRQSIGLLRIGGRVLVVSTTERGADVLTELEGEELGQALAEPDVKQTTFPDVFKRATRLTKLSFLGSFVAFLCVVSSTPAFASVVLPNQDPVDVTQAAPQFALEVGDDGEGLKISGAVGVVVVMTLMTLLPALFLMMTSFTRILIVLHFLRSAIGTQTTPPGQLLVAIAVMLTGVVMAPALEEANEMALQPYLDGQMTQVEAYKAAIIPFREFMLANTPDEELGAFAEISQQADVETIEDVSTVTIMSSFVTSELKVAFKIGFLLFLPFTVVDLVVASVLMSMGMFMLPPVMISLPFKLLLFVLADGWTLITQSLVASFQ